MLLLETQSLSKIYRAGTPAEVRAVEDVSLGIERGGLVALTGPSGSGKSTLLALLGALERPTSGRVLFLGQDLGRCSDVGRTRIRRRMGFVFQDFGLIADLSAEQNVSYPLIPRGVARAERRRLAQELLTRLGMKARVTTPARDLSGGEQQRVAVARALAGRPEVVLADEPTAHLEADTGSVLRAVFQELHLSGTSVVLATHDPLLLTLATRHIELEGGRLKSAF